jgi:hypothetical protein
MACDWAILAALAMLASVMVTLLRHRWRRHRGQDEQRTEEPARGRGPQRDARSQGHEIAPF